MPPTPAARPGCLRSGSGWEAAPCGYSRVTTGGSQIRPELPPLKNTSKHGLDSETHFQVSTLILGKPGRGIFSAAQASADSPDSRKGPGEAGAQDGRGRLPHTLPMTWGGSRLLTQFFQQEQRLVSLNENV